MPKRTRDYHSWQIKQLTDPQTAAAYLNAALNDSKEMFLKALRNVAEAGQMTRVAKKAGVRRESLYRTLSKNGNPRLDTLNSVLHVVGLRMSIQAEASPPGGGYPATAPAAVHYVYSPTQIGNSGFPAISGGNIQDTPSGLRVSGMISLTGASSLPTTNNATLVGGLYSQAPTGQGESRAPFCFGSGSMHVQTVTTRGDMNRRELLRAGEEGRPEPNASLVSEYGFQLAARHGLAYSGQSKIGGSL